CLAASNNPDPAYGAMSTPLAPGTRLALDKSAPVALATPPFNDTPLTATAIVPGALTTIDAQVNAVIDKAVALWQAAIDAGDLLVAGNSTAHVTVTRPTVILNDLGHNELIRTFRDGSFALDPNAAGYGWFVDPTGTAAVPGDKVDLLSALLHQLGHQLGR